MYSAHIYDTWHEKSSYKNVKISSKKAASVFVKLSFRKKLGMVYCKTSKFQISQIVNAAYYTEKYD